MLLQNKQIAIVGGGPGGLTLARLLQLKGVMVTVFERDLNKAARVQGSPLDLHDDSGLAAIIQADLLEKFKNNILPKADRKKILNEDAELFFSDHETKLAEDFGNPHYRPEIDRKVLRELLLESLQPETVAWDSHFVSMEKQNDGWMLSFKNGKSAYADVVIAADGASSKIRPYLTAIKPFYTGITMLEGYIVDAKNATPQISTLLKGGKIMAFGNEKDILMGQKGGGEIGFYVSFKADENWVAASGIDFNDKAALLEWFKAAYPEWSSIWYDLFRKATMPVIPRRITCMPLDQTWATQPNLTMLGDAAHVMPPFAGEGVNMAMKDALELSECLTSGQYDTLREAISVYEINMRKRASAAAEESLQNGEKMHSENALTTMLEFFNKKDYVEEALSEKIRLLRK